MILPFKTHSAIQVNLDMTDSVGPGKLVRHMQNPSNTYDEYMICIGLGPSISSVICKNPSYSGPSYPSSPVFLQYASGQDSDDNDGFSIQNLGIQ